MLPRKKPYFTIACLLYSEQLGLKRQLGEKKCLRYFWYSPIIFTATLANITDKAYAGLFACAP
jgi:hypothetical protein